LFIKGWDKPKWICDCTILQIIDAAPYYKALRAELLKANGSINKRAAEAIETLRSEFYALPTTNEEDCT
jgi:hypothetical protein